MRTSVIALSRRGVWRGWPAPRPAWRRARGRATRGRQPSARPGRADTYRFKLGDFEVTISDGAVQVDGPHPIFGENVSAAEVQELMARISCRPPRWRSASRRWWSTRARSWSCSIPATAPRAGPMRAGSPACWRPPASSRADRPRGAEPFPPRPHRRPGGGGPAALAERALRHRGGQADFWSPQDQLSGPTERVATLVQANVVPLAEKTTFIKERRRGRAGIEALAAFGHTPGHMAFHIESPASGWS